MSTFKAFFKEEITEIEPIKIKLARFKQEIEVKPLSPEKQEELIDSSQKTRINSKGKMEKYVSQGKYARLLVINTMIVPDLEDAALQKNYGVLGAENLLNVMFTADEVNEIIKKLSEESEMENLEDLTEKAKN